MLSKFKLEHVVPEGIHLLNLLEAMGKTLEIELIKERYKVLKLKAREQDYTFKYHGINKSLKINEVCSQLIQMIKNQERIKDIFNTIWDDNEDKIKVEPISVSENDLLFLQEQMYSQLNNFPDVLNNFHNSQDAFNSILYAVIGLKIYCERLKRNLTLPQLRTVAGDLITDAHAKMDFNNLKSNSNLKLYASTGKLSAEFFNYHARATCQFGYQDSLEIFMQKLQFVGKMICYLSRNKMLGRRFTKEQLIGERVPNDFRPVVVKYIVQYHLKSEENNGSLSMFNPTGGWGGRLIGALATPEISRYVETDSNPDLLDIKRNILETYGSDANKAIFLHQSPIETLDHAHYCPMGGNFRENQGHDFSLFSPPYFNIEKYKDKIENNCHTQSYKKFPTLDKWIHEFLFNLININYLALKVAGIMIINVATISVYRNLIANLENLKNKYTNCLSEHSRTKVRVNIPKIIYMHLKSGFEERKWQFIGYYDYDAKNSENVMMFFRTKMPETPLFKTLDCDDTIKVSAYFNHSQKFKKTFFIEESEKENMDLNTICLDTSTPQTNLYMDMDCDDTKFTADLNTHKNLKRPLSIEENERDEDEKALKKMRFN